MGITQKETYPFSVPEPKDGETTPQRVGASPADKMRKAYYDGLEMEAFRKAAGLDSRGKDDNTSAVSNLLMSTMQSYSSALSSLVSELTKAASVATGAKAPEQNQFLQYLINEVQGMKQKMEGGQGDPFALIDEYHTRMTKWQDEMQRRLGVGTQPVAANASSGIESLRLALEIEKMKIESQDRQRMHEADLMERRHRWDIDDRKWQAEFKLKLEELGFNQERSKQTASTFHDLLSSVVESIEPSAEPATRVEKQVAGQPARAEPPPSTQTKRVFPKSYTCDQCKDAFAWPDGKMSASCPHCGTEYELEPVQ